MLSPSGSMLSQEITSKSNSFCNIFYFFIELSRKTQRHMSKAIRRARQMGKGT